MWSTHQALLQWRKLFLVSSTLQDSGKPPGFCRFPKSMNADRGSVVAYHLPSCLPRVPHSSFLPRHSCRSQ